MTREDRECNCPPYAKPDDGGTPKTLTDAILNGVNACGGTAWSAVSLSTAVQQHVRDFLAQKFGVAFLNAPNEAALNDLHALWESITGEKKP